MDMTILILQEDFKDQQGFILRGILIMDPFYYSLTEVHYLTWLVGQCFAWQYESSPGGPTNDPQTYFNPFCHVQEVVKIQFRFNFVRVNSPHDLYKSESAKILSPRQDVD
ncbi:hypothetical protein C8J57DRAFT_1236578 [Mycena rebaudengoi]|nr:hypothetical protein C8J57DRAFT_1236578 [Mycena rebaudengoi]